MKKTLSILFVFVLFTLSYPAFAECEIDYNHSRIGRLPCPLVLKNCTTIEALEENDYLQEGQEYELEELQNFCKSCVVAQSRDSKCITRGLKKCKKKFSASSSSNTGGSDNITSND